MACPLAKPFWIRSYVKDSFVSLAKYGEKTCLLGNRRADYRQSHSKKNYGQFVLSDAMRGYDVYVEGKTIRIPKWEGWAKAAKAKLDKMMTEEAA